VVVGTPLPLASNGTIDPLPGAPSGVDNSGISATFNSDNSVTVDINTAAYNGFAGMPLAPNDPIELSLSVTITADGTATINPGSTYSGYPSLEAYSYQNGVPTGTLADVQAGNISQLGTNDTPIPPEVDSPVDSPINPPGDHGGGGAVFTPDFSDSDSQDAIVISTDTMKTNIAL
jgi:hypothetical protein